MADAVIARSGLGDWSFKTAHTQTRDIFNGSGEQADFISAESVVLAAGPASYKDAITKVSRTSDDGKEVVDWSGIENLYPIGLCESVGIQQNTNIIQLFEVGSRLPYLIPGRTVAQLQLNRVVFNGDSLMGALTAGVLAKFEAGSTADAPGYDFSGKLTKDGKGPDPKYDNKGAFLLNLASSFFKKPFGLAIMIQDSDSKTATGNGRGQWVSGMYAENCLIQSHQMNIQGQQFIVMESAVVRVSNLVPMAGFENPAAS